MENTFTINISTKDGKITDFDIVEGVYNRTEFCQDEIDEPMTLKKFVFEIEDYFKDFVE